MTSPLLSVLIAGEGLAVVAALALPMLLKPTRDLLVACRVVVAVSCAKALLLVVLAVNNTP